MVARRLFFSFLFLGVTGALYAQKKADQRIIAQLKTDIGYLSSDELEGRRTAHGVRALLQIISSGDIKKLVSRRTKMTTSTPFNLYMGNKYHR